MKTDSNATRGRNCWRGPGKAELILQNPLHHQPLAPPTLASQSP